MNPNPHTAGRWGWPKGPLLPLLSIQGLLFPGESWGSITSDTKDGVSPEYGLLALSLDGLSPQAPYGQLPESSIHKQLCVQTGKSDKERSCVTARDKLWAGARIQPTNSTLLSFLQSPAAVAGN